MRSIAARMMEDFLKRFEFYYDIDTSSHAVYMDPEKIHVFDGFAYNPQDRKRLFESMNNPLLIPVVLTWAHETLRGTAEQPWLDKLTEQYLRHEGTYDFTPLLPHLEIDYAWDDYFTDPIGAVIHSIDVNDDINLRIDRLYHLGMDYLENTLHLTYLESLLRSYEEEKHRAGFDRVSDYLDDHQDHVTMWKTLNPERFKSYLEAKQPRVVNPYKGGGFRCIN